MRCAAPLLGPQRRLVGVGKSDVTATVPRECGHAKGRLTSKGRAEDVSEQAGARMDSQLNVLSQVVDGKTLCKTFSRSRDEENYASSGLNLTSHHQKTCWRRSYCFT